MMVSKQKDDDAPGVSVSAVLPGTAAAEAGLKPEDRLLLLDSRWTDSIEDVFVAAKTVKEGHQVSLRIRRAGKESDLTITPRPGW
jgi:S1-C subfamily serine protease